MHGMDRDMLKSRKLPLIIGGAVILGIGLFFGYMIGKSSDRMTVAVRKAQNLSNKGIEEKKDAVAILLKQKELMDYSFKYAQNSRELQIISASLANILVKYEMWNDALKYLEISRQILPADFTLNFNLGYVYYRLFMSETKPSIKDNAYRQSQTYLELAAKLNPEDTETYYYLGLLMYENHLYTDALGYFLMVLTKNPSDVNTLFAAARTYYDTGEKDKARKIYLKLQTLLPKDSPRLDTVIKNLRQLENNSPDGQ